MRKFLIFSISIILISSCGGRKSKASFNLKVASISTGLPIPGGVTMRTVALTDTGPSTTFATIDMVGADHVADIDFGKWNLYFVAFSGPSLWQGTTYCGSITNLTLSAPELVLNVNLNSANCSVEPYLSMIAAKQTTNISTWDSAIWDTSVWEP